jgi:hypothetical protein
MGEIGWIGVRLPGVADSRKWFRDGDVIFVSIVVG